VCAGPWTRFATLELYKFVLDIRTLHHTTTVSLPCDTKISMLGQSQTDTSTLPIVNNQTAHKLSYTKKHEINQQDADKLQVSLQRNSVLNVTRLKQIQH